jgi:ubiquinol-cytochrome c reductase cytochrome b subunit
MMNHLLQWLDQRTGFLVGWRSLMERELPHGPKWRYSIANCLFWLLIIQGLTGLLLMSAYSPSVAQSWASVHFIEQQPGGAFLRGVHYFAAQAMIVLFAIHVIRVLWTMAFRPPRELVWVTGLLLVPLVLVWAITGNPLSGSVNGMSQIDVEGHIMASTPGIGPMLQRILIGGDRVGNLTLTHLYTLHVAVLPVVVGLLLAVHLGQVRRHGLAEQPGLARQAVPYWPYQSVRNGFALLVVLGVISALALTRGAPLHAPAGAEINHSPRPEWYFLPLFELRRYFIGPGEIIATMVIPGAVLAFLILLPLLNEWLPAWLAKGLRIGTIVVGAGAWLALTYSSMGRDARDEGHQASLREGARVAARARLLADRQGVPPEGAVALLRDDPWLQGPRLFAQFCADCHQPHSPDQPFDTPPRAPELASLSDPAAVSFGTRPWIRSVLTGFRNHFRALENIEGDFAESADAILNGSMADWSDTNGPLLMAEANRADAEALVEFLYAQSGRSDALPPDNAQVIRGREIFEGGELADGSFDSACIDCHTMHAVGDDEPLSEDLFPVLTGYGGPAWLREMILRPETHYGGDGAGNNAMPGFADQLSPQQVTLLVRWLTGDYHQP